MILEQLGEVYEGRGDLDGALGYYQSALACSAADFSVPSLVNLGVSEAYVHQRIANILLANEDLNKARMHVGQAISLQPDNLHLIYLRGRIELHGGNHKSAYRDLKIAMNALPDNRDLIRDFNKVKAILAE